MKQKRVAAIHDISGVGKCSLTVALPILSVAGLECCPLPTAVLSNHTGGFKNFTFKDLTDEMLPIVKQWQNEEISFDAIYSGYLGSFKQVDILCEIIDTLKGENTMVLVDPVMGDHGALYKSFDKDFPRKMLSLCKKADVITPNITEACLMLGMEYKKPPYNKEYIETLLKGLTKICSGDIVLTGVCFDENRLGAAAVSKGEIFYCFGDKIDGIYHGTGDVFASVLSAALLKDCALKRAVEAAVSFTCMSIKNTKENYSELWYGVNFEEVLPKLPELLGGNYGR